MSIHVALYHVTSYSYDRLVEMGPQSIRLRPAPHCRTPILSYALKISPAGYFINWQQDPHGNYLARVVYPMPVGSFQVEVDLVAEMSVQNPFDFFLEPEAEKFPFAYAPELRRELDAYLEPEPAGPLLQAWLAAVPRGEQATADFLVGLNRRLQQDVEYLIRMEPGVQSCEDTLRLKRGSCRDSAWLLAEILRHLGLAARFVSGYLIQLTPDVKSLDGPSGPETDFTDLHAWTEVYLPGAGWVGLDPTSGLLAGEGHIPLAATPRPQSAAPITGTLGEAKVDFDFQMKVTRIFESPRVTKPYAAEEWQAIDALGHRIDDALKQQDVRLTLGGEPTFVSVDHVDGEEWNTAATGPTKRALAHDLIRRLKNRFAPGGMLHFGQGKWYPGEPLPRWSFALYWRRDGKPVWQDDSLIAWETADHAPDVATAAAFMRGIAERLEVEPEAALPAYEDPWHFMEKERRLPENLDPSDSKLDDPLERDRLARVFERGLSKPAGYVLPLQRWNAKEGARRWYSERWSTRSKHLFLVPGDSPLGLRLPLPSLPYIPPVDYPYVVADDPFAERTEFPEADARRQRYRRGMPENQDSGNRQIVVGQSLKGKFVRAALAVEPRGGRLCVFMPPTETADDYLDLVAAIEDAAAEMKMPIHLEGYGPPHDPRLDVIKVTPDPGVIEVNIQPAHDWPEMVAITMGLYEDAHLSRLTTEKFMLDGRHTGTGGGNHVVAGGATAADSPFLRRPDLLRSLVAYWQHHPGLSYLFSGLFIGPTSQHPRVDEARHDSLYELELAFREIPEPESGKAPPPWLVDRVFRNLLIDVSGNTHRTEICIDKLYSPDGPTGRLGLVEFRAFEMPPHPEMSLTQRLLLRALIARFWRDPYRHDLVRWGTQLHDRFMLPHYVWRDIADVVAELRDSGFPFDLAWFAPHFEFRFPRYGSVRYGDIEIEIRQALEPWHVLGEEGAAGGTVRYVDSSVERVQVRVTGLTGGRYVVGCNGKEVPLAPTGTAGEAVAGVRYRAWKPASALHPTIPIDAPLVFDLYDRWTGRAVAGCTYHVAHPGGRNFEHFPVNSYEAESRRLARFEQIGHSVGAAPPPGPSARPEFPLTLDLRWP